VVPSFDPNNMTVVLAIVLSGVMYIGMQPPVPLTRNKSRTDQKIVMGLIFGLIVRWFTPVPVTWKGGIVAAGKSTLLCNK